MATETTEEVKLIEFLDAAPVGLVEITASGAIALINPYAMKHLLPLAGARDTGNLFAMLNGVAPELRNMFEGFTAERGTVCDGHRILVDLTRDFSRDRSQGARLYAGQTGCQPRNCVHLRHHDTGRSGTPPEAGRSLVFLG